VSKLPKVQTHPFPFLLYLEWALLGVAALSELLLTPTPRVRQFPMATLLSIAGLWLMGLRLPAGRPAIQKLLYTGLEFWLIVLAGGLSPRGIRLFPFLYLVLVIRSCLLFKLPGRLMVTGLAFSAFLLTLLYRMQTLNLPGRPMVQDRIRFLILNLTLNAALLFGLILILVLFLINALLAERESRDKLAIANEQLRQYALRIEDQATLQERNRIARDIHDSLGHALTGLNIQLEGALKLWQTNPTKAQAFLAEAKRLGSTALQAVRQSVATLRSDPLQGQSLELAIARLAQEFQQTTGILPTCDVKLTRSLPSEVKTAVYRIIQESLTNICKHAAASAVQIQVETAKDLLLLQVRDNGNGFEVNENTTGFGVQGMQERSLVLGGHFTIESQPGSGCRILAKLPLPKSPQ
jgi:signal transduction histidine kinase